MSAQAAGGWAHGNRGDGLQAGEVDGGDGAVASVADIGVETQTGAENGRALLGGDLARGDDEKYSESEEQARVEAERAHVL